MSVHTWSRKECAESVECLHDIGEIIVQLYNLKHCDIDDDKIIMFIQNELKKRGLKVSLTNIKTLIKNAKEGKILQ